MLNEKEVKILSSYLKNKEDLDENLKRISLKLELLNEIQEANRKLDSLIKEEVK